MSNQTPGRPPEDELPTGDDRIPDLPPPATAHLEPEPLLPPMLSGPTGPDLAGPSQIPNLPPSALPPQVTGSLPAAMLPPSGGTVPDLPAAQPQRRPAEADIGQPAAGLDATARTQQIPPAAWLDNRQGTPPSADLPPAAITTTPRPPATATDPPPRAPVVENQPATNDGVAGTTASKPAVTGAAPTGLERHDSPPATHGSTAPKSPADATTPAARAATTTNESNKPRPAPTRRPAPTSNRADAPAAGKRPKTAGRPTETQAAGKQAAGKQAARTATTSTSTTDKKITRGPASPPTPQRPARTRQPAGAPTVAGLAAPEIHPEDPLAPRGLQHHWRINLLQSTPPWMISSIMHMGLLMALALCYIPQAVDVFLEIVVEQSEEIGEQMVSDVIVIPSLEASDIPDLEVAVASTETQNPLATIRKLEIDELDPVPDVETTSAPTPGKGLDGRQAGAKRALLAAYGGTGQTESAVQLGLEWLKRNQQRDGSWSLEGPYANGGSFENRPAATAMALLALQGAGNTHQAGDFRTTVERGVQALLKMQDTEGTVIRHVRVENHRLYTQAQATIALCELYGMTQDEALRQPAQRALDYAVKIQADDGQGGGGWRYMPGQYVDTSVTGWFVMALQSGTMAGLSVPQATLDKVSQYLDHVTDDGVNYQYLPDYEPSVVMTAEALLCRQYLGWGQEDPRLTAGVAKLLSEPIDWSQRDVYYWYYATQVLHHMGGETWDQWNRSMRKTLPSNQESAGRNRGSWHPIGDSHGHEGGRLYTTCFCLYMLEVYYRHLPLYQHK